MYQNFNQYNPYQIPQPQPQRASQSNLEWIMVQSVNQVDSVAVQPNSKAWIMVQNEPIFALRTADQMGLTTTEFYRFEKYNPSAQSSDYVTASQLEEALNKLRGELNESIIQTGSNRSKDKTINANA